jgi:hypothetical protein
MKGITESAAKKLYRALAASDLSEDRCVRFVTTADGADLMIGKRRPGDKVFTHKGRVVLVVEPSVAEGCEWDMLDYQDGSFCFA